MVITQDWVQKQSDGFLALYKRLKAASLVHVYSDVICMGIFSLKDLKDEGKWNYDAKTFEEMIKRNYLSECEISHLLTLMGKPLWLRSYKSISEVQEFSNLGKS